jgi:nucleoside-diphosphate-sugar epimerase
VDALNKAFGKDVKPTHIQNPVKEDYVQGQYADISKIQKILGYKPTIKLEVGIMDQVENLRMDRIRGTSSDRYRLA